MEQYQKSDFWWNWKNICWTVKCAYLFDAQQQELNKVERKLFILKICTCKRLLPIAIVRRSVQLLLNCFDNGFISGAESFGPIVNWQKFQLDAKSSCWCWPLSGLSIVCSCLFDESSIKVKICVRLSSYDLEKRTWNVGRTTVSNRIASCSRRAPALFRWRGYRAEAKPATGLNKRASATSVPIESVLSRAKLTINTVLLASLLLVWELFSCFS